MRIGIVLERKSEFRFNSSDPLDRDSEFFSDAEEDALLSGLRDAGHEVVRIGDGHRLVARPGYWRRRCELVFNLSVGHRGIDRKSHVPGVLELAGIPYVGSDAYALSLTRHKYHAKLVAAAAGVRTASSVLWEDEACTPSLSSLEYPAIVKPVAESSSLGIEKDVSVVRTAEAAALRAKHVTTVFDQPALVETFIRGTEVEVPVLGWPLRALGGVGITVDGQLVTGDAYLTSDSVYSDGYGFLASMPGLDADKVARVALLAARALGIRDYGRIDFRLASDGTPYFMEASTHPHIQEHSSFFALAKAGGRSYPEMLDEIIAAALARLGPQSSQNSMSQKYQGSR